MSKKFIRKGLQAHQVLSFLWEKITEKEKGDPMNKRLDPITYYIMLCEDVDDELRERLIRYMVQNGYMGEANRVSRRELAIALLGEFTDGTDRIIRKAKEGLPILSSSGKSGYYLPEFQDEVDAYIKENTNRITSLQQNNRLAEKIELPYLQKRLHFLDVSQL